ncbi:MAG: IS630 family transposase [Acidobacteria bacterium]|nr:IS630 family transposase [Acidobacteriota bacterium]MCW5971673.1 IS630 family transposase [Blastocatellales bacterium]
MIRELRRGRYGFLLTIHILLLCAAGKNPSQIAEFLFCSRSSVYRAVKAFGGGELDKELFPEPVENQERCLGSRFQRSLRWLVEQSPRAFGWMRVRWSCATLALTIKARMGLAISRETVRGELHAQGYVWKRAKLKAKDDDPQRARKLASIRRVIENLGPEEAFFWVDELDIHLLAKVGCQWTLKGTTIEIPTPGKNQKQYLAAALNLQTGEMIYLVGPRKTNALFRELLTLLDRHCGPQIKRIYLGADNYVIHKAKAVGRFLDQHPRFKILWLPTYCPKSNLIERAFWEVHDKCTRNHTRKRLSTLVHDVKQHLQKNEPWKYKIPDIYYEPEVDAELNTLYLEDTLAIAA